MALRRTIAKHLYNRTIKNQSPLNRTLDYSPFISPSSQKALNAAKANFQRELLTSPENSSSTADAGFFRRLLQRRKLNQSSKMILPELFYFPVGEKLREKLNISGGGLMPPTKERAQDTADFVRISMQEARKILRCSQLQKVRSELNRIPSNSITYGAFLSTCSDVCRNHDQGVVLAKTLDEAGDVIVLGNVVFLHPDQIAKSMEKLISQSLAIPNDPRKQELEELETQKAFIDQRAVSQVRSELYCGLGFLVVQMLGFMRLTFWELSWDVMEPICFFFTSLDFAFAYVFFLRTSKEPSFEGYFQCRFKVKQRKLMEEYNFNCEKYNELHKAFYPHCQSKICGSDHVGSLSRVFGNLPC